MTLIVVLLICLTVVYLILSSGWLGRIKIFPIESTGYIKVTTFDRTLCKRNITYVHPQTKAVVRRSREIMDNCIPIWEVVASPYLANTFDHRFNLGVYT